MEHQDSIEENCDRQHMDTCRAFNQSKDARLVDAHASSRNRITDTQHRDYEDHIAEREFNSLRSLHSCAQAYPYAPGNENY